MIEVFIYCVINSSVSNIEYCDKDAIQRSVKGRQVFFYRTFTVHEVYRHCYPWKDISE
jgi:hypothetical protein